VGLSASVLPKPDQVFAEGEHVEGLATMRRHIPGIGKKANYSQNFG
jgi:hypothetical protein